VRARGRRAIRPAHGAETAIAVRTLAPDEALGVASLLARAFRDSPLNVAVIGGTPERRLRVNLHGMRALLPTAARCARVAAADRSGLMLGALIATPPLCYPVPPAPLASRIRCLLGQGPGVTRRWAAVFRALDALHPREPHWYLATLGVDPDSQGEGIGSALASSFLKWADRDARPAYLETDRPENVSFYERLGFRVEHEVEVLGAPIWRMLRTAASP